MLFKVVAPLFVVAALFRLSSRALFASVGVVADGTGEACVAVVLELVFVLDAGLRGSFILR